MSFCVSILFLIFELFEHSPKLYYGFATLTLTICFFLLQFFFSLPFVWDLIILMAGNKLKGRH